jgi:hypothetical protein
VRNLDGFLDALAQLEASNDFLMQHSQLAAVQAAVEHSQVRLGEFVSSSATCEVKEAATHDPCDIVDILLIGTRAA